MKRFAQPRIIRVRASSSSTSSVSSKSDVSSSLSAISYDSATLSGTGVDVTTKKRKIKGFRFDSTTLPGSKNLISTKYHVISMHELARAHNSFTLCVCFYCTSFSRTVLSLQLFIFDVTFQCSPLAMNIPFHLHTLFIIALITNAFFPLIKFLVSFCFLRFCHTFRLNEWFNALYFLALPFKRLAFVFSSECISPFDCAVWVV